MVNETEGFSIIVATKGRAELLECLLASLKTARKNYQGNTEILLIDDSEPDEANFITGIADKYDAKILRYGPSVSGKRNFGAKNAIYSRLLFLDSDCVADEHLIQCHRDMYLSDQVAGVFGLLKFTGHENKFWGAVSKSPFIICFSMPLWGRTSDWAVTANFSVYKDIFLSIGGFNETFPNKPGGEDVDLGLRITKTGKKIVNAPNALVLHDKKTWSDKKSMFSRCWHYGRADAYLVLLHHDYSCFAAPRNSVIYLVMLLMFAGGGCFLSPWCFLSIPVYIIEQNAFYLILRKKFGYGHKSVYEQFYLNIMDSINEMGYISMSIKLKKFLSIFKQTYFFTNQLNSIMANGNLVLASHGFSLAVILILWSIGVRIW